MQTMQVLINFVSVSPYGFPIYVLVYMDKVAPSPTESKRLFFGMVQVRLTLSKSSLTVFQRDFQKLAII